MNNQANYCTYCGATVKGKRFCSNCGADLATITSTLPTPAPPPSQKSPSVGSISTFLHGKNKAVLIGIAVVAVIGVFLIGAGLFGDPLGDESREVIHNLHEDEAYREAYNHAVDQGVSPFEVDPYSGESPAEYDAGINAYKYMEPEPGYGHTGLLVVGIIILTAGGVIFLVVWKKRRNLSKF